MTTRHQDEGLIDDAGYVWFIPVAPIFIGVRIVRTSKIVVVYHAE